MKLCLKAFLAAAIALLLGIIFVDLTHPLFYNATIGPACAWGAYLTLLIVGCTAYLAALIRKHH